MFLRMDSFVLLFIRDVWMDRGQNPHPSLYLFHVNELFVFYYKRKKERKKMMSYLMYVFFANLRGSLWIIFYFIAPKQEFYGISCSPYLCSLGDSFFGERYHVKSTWFLCSLFAYFGQFGENEIKELLKTRNKLIKR